MLNTYRILVEVDALARQRFVERIVDDRLVDGAVHGMMRRLDPYSGYIGPDELEAFERRGSEEYFGIGVEIGMRGGRPVVITPLDASPAAMAGVRPGDVIISVNETDTEGLSAFDLGELLQGHEGAPVHLTIQRNNSVDPIALSVPRRSVKTQTVRGFRKTQDGAWDYLIDPTSRLGYVRVSSFHKSTASAFDQAIAELERKEIVGLVLDLRFDPGGLIDQAIHMVDRFIEDDVIVSTITRRNVFDEYRGTPGQSLADCKLVILINGASASAAEIVAGALQDYERATIVGERSFGKGSVQGLIYLKTADAAVKITHAYYRLPSGRVIHRTAANRHSDSWGIQPDVEILLSDEEKSAIQKSRLRVDLPQAMAGGERLDESSLGDSGSSATPQVISDRQLAKALALLQSG